MPDNKNKNKEAIQAYKDSVRQAESGGNSNAKAPTSSATGLYQFTEATWKEMEKKLGKKLDIFNKKDQELAMGKLTELNVNALEKNGLPVTPSNLYMTHFLGVTGGPKFLKNLEKNPNELASKYVSAGAVKANENLFYNDNKPVTASELYNKMSSKVGDSNTLSEQVQSTPQFTPAPETNEAVQESTYTTRPRLNRDLKPSKQSSPKSVVDNTILNNSPVEGARNILGLSGSLDFLPKDLNLAYSEEEQLNQELSDPDELINIAKYGGTQKSINKNTISDANPSYNNLVEFNEGGSHEENPNGGVYQGIGANGKINTVEEGETKYNDYVYSDTLKVNDDNIESLFLPKEIAGKTFAEASKYINSILEDNPNDQIIKRTVDKQLDSLMLGNEKARLAKEQLDINLGNNNLITDLEDDTNELFVGGELNQELSLPGLNEGLGVIGNLAMGDNDAALNNGIKAGTTIAGTAIGGPIGGMIGGFVGDLAGGLLNKGRMKRANEEESNKRQIINAGAYQNDFEVGGDLNDPKYIPNLDDPLFGENMFTTPLSNDMLPNPGYNITDNQPIWGTELLSDFTPDNTVNNNTTETNKYNPKGKNYLQYAPVLGDFLNFREANRDTPETERLNKIDRRFTPDYVDESYLQNIVNNNFDNTVNSLTNATNGSQGSLRNNILAAGIGRNRGLSDAYFRADDINRGQFLQGQQFDLGVDQFNIGQDNQERDINARNRAAVEDRRRAARDTLFRDIGAIGREQTYDNRLYNLTGGYDSMGNYDPNNISFLEQLGLGDINNPNKKKEGGFLSTAFSTAKENKMTKIEDEFNKRYK